VFYCIMKFGYNELLWLVLEVHSVFYCIIKFGYNELFWLVVEVHHNCVLLYNEVWL
jgi:hypothetical protein